MGIVPKTVALWLSFKATNRLLLNSSARNLLRRPPVQAFAVYTVHVVMLVEVVVVIVMIWDAI